ncbi:MAG: hypothetical protein WC791_01805 [Candidatus Paceibacterota bacterium]|jgi:hypothetical protein
MNLSDEANGIIVTASRNSDNETPHSYAKTHEGEEPSLHAFEGQGVSIIKKKDLPPCLETDDQASREVLAKSGVEIVTCYLEDLE